MASAIDSALRSRIEASTNELSTLVKQAALDAVQNELGGVVAAPATRGPGRPAKSGMPSPIVTPKRRGKRAERTPEDVARMGEAVVAHVAKNPGRSVEQIAKALNVTTKDLALPMIRMLDEKKLSK